MSERPPQDRNDLFYLASVLLALVNGAYKSLERMDSLGEAIKVVAQALEHAGEEAKQ